MTTKSTSLFGSASSSASVKPGKVKITFARIEDGKQLAGSCSIPGGMDNTLPQDAMAYVIQCADRDAVLRTIAEESGETVDSLLTHLQNEFAPAPAETETVEA